MLFPCLFMCLCVFIYPTFPQAFNKIISKIKASVWLVLLPLNWTAFKTKSCAAHKTLVTFSHDIQLSFSSRCRLTKSICQFYGPLCLFPVDSRVYDTFHIYHKHTDTCYMLWTTVIRNYLL